MRVRVVDASAMGALVFGEPPAGRVVKDLGDGPVVGPALLWFELASICLKKRRAHPRQAEHLLDAFRRARQLVIDIVDVEHAEVVQLAEESGLTTYDAAYLWLARRLDGVLVTLDETLQKAHDSLGA